MPLTRSRWALEQVAYPVSVLVPELGSGVPDPTGDPVAFQFTVGGLPVQVQPVEDGWTPGSWVQTAGGLLAACLVGPGGGVSLAPGVWTVWIQIIDGLTTVVEAIDSLTIT